MASYYEIQLKDLPSVEHLSSPDDVIDLSLSEDIPHISNVKSEFIAEAKKLPLARGDLVRLNCSEEGNYRNDNLFIFNGKELEDLCFDYDEYGSLPPDYQVTETDFHPFYWAKCRTNRETFSYNEIVHNSIFFLSKGFKQMFIDNIKWEKYTWTSTITLKGYQLTLVYNGEASDPDHLLKGIRGEKNQLWVRMASGREVAVKTEKYKEECIELAKRSLDEWKRSILDEKTAFEFPLEILFLYFLDEEFHDEIDERENVCIIRRP